MLRYCIYSVVLSSPGICSQETSISDTSRIATSTSYLSYIIYYIYTQHVNMLCSQDTDTVLLYHYCYHIYIYVYI